MGFTYVRDIIGGITKKIKIKFIKYGRQSYGAKRSHMYAFSLEVL